jgi:hypothetical protein
MNAVHRVAVRRSQRRAHGPKNRSRELAFQPLEPRHLLAGVGDWAVIDLRAALTDGSTQFSDLSGVVFYGDQVAVTANVQPGSGDAAAKLVLVNVDLDAHTAQVGSTLTIPSLGGDTQALAVNTNGTVIYVTGSSVSDLAATGEAFRAVWDGTQLQNLGLGSIPSIVFGPPLFDPVYQSTGYAVTPDGIVAGTSDEGRALFEYYESMVYVGASSTLETLLAISDDRIKVGTGISTPLRGTVWEADNQTHYYVEDSYGDGTLLQAISPDASRLLGTSNDRVGNVTTGYLTWWTLDGNATVVTTGGGDPVAGQFTSGTNADVGYLVGKAGVASSGDLLHIESTNQTMRVVDWFQSLSGQSLAGETSDWGPEISYDYGSGQVAIISGGYLFVAKIQDTTQIPVAVADNYTATVNVPLTVPAAGVLANDAGSGTLSAVLVSGPSHGTLQFNSDGSFTYTPQTGFNREDTFTYLVNNGTQNSNVGTVRITMDTPYPWHNGLLPRDVNDDGAVTPIDALQIINRINSVGSGPLPSRPHPLTAPFYDARPVPDNFVSPIDALYIINYLNNPQGGGESGEGESGTMAGAAGDSGEAATLAVVNLPVVVSSHAATPLASSTSTLQLPPAATWSSDVLETGFATSSMSRDDQVWAEPSEQWGCADLDELLSVLLAPGDDEA